MKPSFNLVRKQLLITVSAFHLFQATAQEAEKQLNWAISPSFSLDYDYRTLVVKEHTETYDIIAANRDSDELPKTGFTGGINVSRRIGERFWIESGLLYSVKGYRTKTMDINTSVPDPLLPKTFTLFYQYHYLDLPFRFGTVFGKNKWQFVPAVGLVINTYLKTYNVSVYDFEEGGIEYGRTKVRDPLHPIMLSATVGLGFSYRINEKTSMMFEPIFRHALQTNSNTPISEYLWNPGLNLACSYRF